VGSNGISDGYSNKKKYIKKNDGKVWEVCDEFY
jgi:hypothetical protein